MLSRSMLPKKVARSSCEAPFVYWNKTIREGATCVSRPRLLHAGAGSDGRHLPDVPVRSDEGKRRNSSSSAIKKDLLSALDRLEAVAGADELGDSDTESVDATSAGHEIDEDDLVDELLAAAGLSEDGLPLYTESLQLETLESDNRGQLSSRRLRRARRADDPPSREARIPDELLPKVAVVGRPNVGKSALFNRIVGKQIAIVYDYPGVTRDRLYTRASWGGREFMLVDTGGLMSEAAALPGERRTVAMHSLSAEGLPIAIERQAAAAVEEAAVVILVVDGQTGSTASDEEVLMWLRRTHPTTAVVLAVNKCENVAKADQQVAEFWGMGPEPIAVSAISGTGSGELLDAVVAALPPQIDPSYSQDEGPTPVSLAIIGRPNVGKSSLLNALVGEERSIVSDMAGTTRDAVDTEVMDEQGRVFTLIDTAGVRRRAAVSGSKDGAEPLSVERAFRAVRRAEVAVLVIDATEGITQQDFRLAEYVAVEGRACVVVVNKWDAIPSKTGTTLAEYETNVRSQLRPVEWANVVFTSAKTGQRVKRVLDAAMAAAEEHRRRITTATLNLVIQDATSWRAPPSTGSGRRGRVYYGTQAGVKPPTFVMFCNDPGLFGEEYKRYMERQFRENIGFPGTPLRIYWRGKSSGGD